ncbi:DddA-like double-stranded DNA deaminase toxin [Actinopolyspora halophila]|uniref:DddA-like double-stranded DNA deaminase toxin n=1 Tax=Actinopolyspora halophila TaxID=1850 RepID=UPI00035E8C94|nr:DddA-like double-stranded DNA deaminase toxin [Actinopolyspora halophila]
MSSLEELGEQLASVLAKLAESQTALTHARHRLGESGQALVAIVDEHTHPDLSAGIPAYREAWSTTTEISETLVSVDKTIRTYMTSIGAPGAETAGVPDDEASPPMVAAPSSENTAQPDQSHGSTLEFGSSEWAIDVGTTLPTYITSGHVFDDTGAELELDGAIRQSGPSESSPQIDQHLRSGVFSHHDPRGKIAVSEHVETKLAWYMSQHGIGHMHVVINNAPCRGLFNCRRAVAAILVKGTSLTVWSAQGGVRYELKGARNDHQRTRS